MCKQIEHSDLKDIRSFDALRARAGEMGYICDISLMGGMSVSRGIPNEFKAFLQNYSHPGISCICEVSGFYWNDGVISVGSVVNYELPKM